MLKIRLMRIGAKGRPFYRVVAVDERNKRNGAYLELLGTYNPLTDPHEINLKQDRIDEWVKKGAQLSDGFLRIIGKAPQKPPRKPKKAPKEEPKPAETPATETPVEETATEEITTDETPVEKPTDEVISEEPASTGDPSPEEPVQDDNEVKEEK